MMNLLLPAFLIFFSFCSISQDYKVISDPTECKKELETKSKTTKTISAEFKETLYSSMFNTPKSGTGQLKYKKEGKIRWEKTSPKSDIILINGGSIRMKQDGKEVSNASRNKIAKKMQSLMVKLINHDFLNEKEFSINYYQSNSSYKLILTPKSARLSNYILSIELTFNKSTLALDKIAINESEDDYVVYSFSSVVFNSIISDNVFSTF
ncbi:MAG: outer membrane lipoprotein-sorting protein [Crocinitomix sp.]|jgi:outer membrane lipoprotein-sorting protein